MSLERPVAPDPYLYLPTVGAFTVTSSDLVEGTEMPLAHVHHSAGGANISPSWSGPGSPRRPRGSR